MASTASPHDLIARFRDAIGVLERDRVVDPLVELYEPDGAAGSILVDAEADPTCVAHFRSTYRARFGDVESRFDRTVATEDGGLLEWTTVGTIDGAEVTYDGVTVLAFDDGTITRSHAYFDPRVLGRPVLDADAG